MGLIECELFLKNVCVDQIKVASWNNKSEQYLIKFSASEENIFMCVSEMWLLRKMFCQKLPKWQKCVQLICIV